MDQTDQDMRNQKWAALREDIANAIARINSRLDIVDPAKVSERALGRATYALQGLVKALEMMRP